MDKLSRYIRYLIFFFLFINVTLIFSVALILLPIIGCSLMVDKRRIFVTKISAFLCRCFLRGSYFWKINCLHNPHLQANKTYIYVANHQSLLDILAAFFIKYPFKFVAKQMLFSVPIVGQYMRLSKMIPIRRGDKESIEQMLKTASEQLLAKNSLFFFPEGSRVLENTVKPFKKGAFLLAIKQQVPIVPVAIHCIKKPIMQKILSGKGRESITVKVLDPIFPEEKDTAQTLAEKSHKAIATELDL